MLMIETHHSVFVELLDKCVLDPRPREEKEEMVLAIKLQHPDVDGGIKAHLVRWAGEPLDNGVVDPRSTKDRRRCC